MFVHRLTHILPSFSLMNCPLCRENQYSFNNLKNHMKSVHQVQEKWFCPICPDGRTFTQNHSLLGHIATFHFVSTKAAPAQYPCQKCNTSFTSKALLGKHFQSEHCEGTLSAKKARQIACYLCHRKMEDLAQLRRHLINHSEHQFGKQSQKKSQKINNEEFTAKFLEFSKKHFKSTNHSKVPKPSFSISSILSTA